MVSREKYTKKNVKISISRLSTQSQANSVAAQVIGSSLNYFYYQYMYNVPMAVTNILHESYLQKC